eukprot:s119_g47.t1
MTTGTDVSQASQHLGLKRKWDLNEEVAASSEVVSLHVMSCQSHSNHSFSNNLKMPWDRKLVGPHEAFLAVTCIPTAVKEATRPCVVETAQPVAKLVENNTESAFKLAGLRALKACEEKLWSDRLSSERKAAIRKWAAIVTSDPMAWEICRRHMAQGDMVYAHGGIGESVRDALESKASSTLHNRANPLCRFMKFCSSHGLKPWPIRECYVYDFLKSDEKFAPRFPRSLLVSISFARHVLGLIGETDLTMSGRTKGVSDSWFKKKRKLLQREPLSVEQVIQLERIVMDAGKTTSDRIAAGFFAFALYCRARYSDALNISKLNLDVVERNGRIYGFLEGESSRVKTSMTLERKTRFLPMTAPVNTVTGLDWIRTWMKLREDERLETGQDKPLLPAPAERGAWAHVPLTASGAASWLKSLVAGAGGPKAEKLGAHSLKTTLLSWSAKYGLSVTDRRALGYHSGPSDRSVMTHSRDAMAGPLRSLQKVIDAVASKSFCPDSTRSGYFPAGDHPEGLTPGEEFSDVSSESSADEEDKDFEGEEAAVDEVAGSWQGTRNAPWAMMEVIFFRHRTSRYLHALLDEGGADLMWQAHQHGL